MSEPVLTAPPSLEPGARPGEGCPPPLAWSEVLAAFRSERDEFLMSTSWGEVQLWEFGRGPGLVFLGGAAGDCDLFALTAWLLRDERRCQFITLPDPPHLTTPNELRRGWADLVHETLASRDGAAAVFAAGAGGLIALELAVEYPDDVSALVLQGVTPRVAWTTSERLLLAAASRLPGRLGGWPGWGRIVEVNHRSWFPPFDVTRWEFLKSNLAATPLRRFARRVRLDAGRDWETRLGRIRCPTLIVRTEGEGARVTAGQEALAAALPQPRSEWMHSAGQYPYLTHPHRLVKVIREFLMAPAASAAAAAHD